MPGSDQGAGPDRYAVIPRTAIFVRRGDEYLLMKGAPAKRLWPGKYNGLGGHVERGEDVLSSARRELLEETGLEADIWLCGTIFVDAGPTGICLFVLLGENPRGELRSSPEGRAEWIAAEEVPGLPAVEDLPALIARLRRVKRGDPPFAGTSAYDEAGSLVLTLVG